MNVYQRLVGGALIVASLTVSSSGETEGMPYTENQRHVEAADRMNTLFFRMVYAADKALCYQLVKNWAQFNRTLAHHQSMTIEYNVLAYQYQLPLLPLLTADDFPASIIIGINFTASVSDRGRKNLWVHCGEQYNIRFVL